MPVGEKFGEGVALTEADLEGEKAAGAEEVEGLGDEAAVDVEAVGAGVEGERGLVVADLRGEGGVVEGDVGRVGGDDVEGGGVEGVGGRGAEEGVERVGAEDEWGEWVGGEKRIAGGVRREERREEVTFEEADAGVETEAAGVVAGDGEGGRGDVDGSEVGVLEDGGERDGDRAGAGADVGDVKMRVGLGAGEVEDGFDEMLGFGAWDEDFGGDAEGEAEELLRAGEVLERMLRGAAGDERAEGVEVRRGQVVVGVGEEPGTVAMQDVGEQGLGVAAGDEAEASRSASRRVMLWRG